MLSKAYKAGFVAASAKGVIMRLSVILSAALLTAVAMIGFGRAADAADLGPIYGSDPAPTADQPLEFGTGWYLRGDGAFSFEDHPKLDTSRTQFDRNAKGDGYAFSLGAGYKFNSFLRVDLTGDYLDPYRFAAQTSCGGACGQNANDKVTRFDGLANAYLDLGNWGGFTPYIGAGAGVGGSNQDATVAYSNGTTYALNRTTYQFAWAAMAGVSYSITPNMMVDIGYRYLDLGRLAVAVPAMPSLQKDIAAHQIRLGIRYVID